MDFIIRNGLNVRVNIVGDVDKYLNSNEDKVTTIEKSNVRKGDIKMKNSSGKSTDFESLENGKRKSRKVRRTENRIKLKVVTSQLKSVEKIEQKMLDLNALEKSYKAGIENLKKQQDEMLKSGDLSELENLKKLENELKFLHEKLSAGYSECIPDNNVWESLSNTAEDISDIEVVDIMQELSVDKNKK